MSFASFAGSALLIVSAAFVISSLSGCDSGKTVEPEPPKRQAPLQRIRSVEKPPSEPGDTVKGKLVYEEHCHFCHGRQGRGDGPVGIAVSPHPANFVSDRKRMNKTDEELFESVTEGITKELGGDEMAMPAWKSVLTAKERWDAIAYIRKLSREGRKASSH